MARSRVTIRLNERGIVRLLKLPATRQMVEEHAAAIAGEAGPGHRVDSEIGPVRARAAVITDTDEARRNEATDRTLSRAAARRRR